MPFSTKSDDPDKLVAARSHEAEPVRFALEAAGISPMARGETLGITDFTRLAEALARLRPDG